MEKLNQLSVLSIIQLVHAYINIHRENYRRYQKYLSYIQKGRYTSIFEKCIYCIYIFSMQNFQTCMYIFISGFQMWIKCHKGEDYFPFRHTRTVYFTSVQMMVFVNKDESFTEDKYILYTYIEIQSRKIEVLV